MARSKTPPVTARNKRLSEKHLKDSIKFNKDHAKEHLKQMKEDRKQLKKQMKGKGY